MYFELGYLNNSSLNTPMEQVRTASQPSSQANRDNQPDTLFYDEGCRLCRATVGFIQQRDRQGHFRFAALQGPAGQRAAQQAGLDPDAPGSLILQDAEGFPLRSDGALRVAARLPWPWSLLRLARWLVPRGLRDALYNYVARNRARWNNTGKRA